MCVCAEMDRFLNLLEWTCGNSAAVQCIVQPDFDVKGTFLEMLKRVLVHGKAFDTGLITAQRLADVLLTPFLLLATTINRVSRLECSESLGTSQAQAGPSTAPLLAGSLEDIKIAFTGWSLLLAEIHYGWPPECDNRGLFIMKPAKRAALIKALIDAKAPEV